MLNKEDKIFTNLHGFEDPFLQGALKRGIWSNTKEILKKEPNEIIELVKASQLRGRGGAGFSTGLKWSFMPKDTGKQHYLVVNADESEPGTCKDREMIRNDPHMLIEGCLIASYAIQATKCYIYIRGEYFFEYEQLEKAIKEAYDKNFVGKNACGSDFDFDIYVHRGAGAYICGEETGLIESLEGKRANPRIKPPYFPAALGLYQCPTIVNNVETLCDVKHILEMGGKAFSEIGTPGNTGTRIWCVSGHVQKPGYYEFPCAGLTLGELIYDVCGGLLPGKKLKAVIPGGSSSKILRADERFKGKLKDGTDYDWGIEDIPMDFDSLSLVGSMSGSGGVIIMDDSTDMVEALANINYFYAHESCGQCTPCREGVPWMKKITGRMCSGKAREEDADLLVSIADQIAGRTICAFGEAASWPVQSFIAKFKDEFVAKAKEQELLRQQGIDEVKETTLI